MSGWTPKIVKLGAITTLPNSDFLEMSNILDEYPVIFRKGSFKEGELVSFIPYDSVVPDTEEFNFLAPSKKDANGIPKPLETGSVPQKYRTIRARQLRGTYSEGLILKAPEGFSEGDSIIDYYKLTKRVYEEELSELPDSGSNENEKAPKTFQLFKYDLQALANYSSHFSEGEQVLITEKCEGENITYIYAENKLWVRSRNYFKRNGFKRKNKTILNKIKNLFLNIKQYFYELFNDKQSYSHWWDVAIRLNLEEKLKKYPYYAIWCESIGKVKHFPYDCQIVDSKIQLESRVFDIYDIKNKRFLEWDQVEKIVQDIGLKTVPVLYKGPWKTDRSLHYLAEGKSAFGNHVREGFVMRSLPEAWSPYLGRKIIKLKGRDYKLFKG